MSSHGNGNSVGVRSRMLDRQRLILLILSLTGVGVFLFTTFVARAEQRWRQEDARSWFAAGERAAGQGKTEVAATAFRRAVALERDKASYVLALASTLAQSGQAESAQRHLQRLRLSHPADSRVNVALARVFGARGDIQGAIEHYQDALHGDWPTDAVQGRQDVRLELIRLLLDHQQQTQALSEILVLAANSSESPETPVMLGDLYLAAGDPGRAAAAYRRKLRVDPDDRTVRDGLGTALFRMGEYAAAQRELALVDVESPRSRELRQLTSLILARDPLEPSLGPRERRTRVMALVTHAVDRGGDCLAASSPPPSANLDRIRTLRADAERVRQAWVSLDRRRASFGSVEDATLLAAVLERETADCVAQTPEGRATILIAERHRLEMEP